MNFQRGRRQEEPEINLIPLIDIMLVLIIFLVLTTTFSKVSGLEINLPTGEALEAHIQTSTPRLLAMANALIGRSLEVGLDEDRPRDRTIKS